MCECHLGPGAKGQAWECGRAAGVTIQSEASLQGGEFSSMLMSWVGAGAEPGGGGGGEGMLGGGGCRLN